MNPYIKIAGWLVLVGIAAIVVNMGSKRAYDLWQASKQ